MMATLRYWILIVTNNKKLQLGTQHAANELWREQQLSPFSFSFFFGVSQPGRQNQLK